MAGTAVTAMLYFESLEGSLVDLRATEYDILSDKRKTRG